MITREKTYNVYHRQIIEIANEAKTKLVITGNVIKNETSNETLGKIVRLMYEEQCKQADAQIEYIKSLQNAS